MVPSRAAGEAGDDVGLGCGLAVVFAAHQIAVGDDGGEESFGDDVGGVGAVRGRRTRGRVEGYGQRRGEGPGGGGPDDGVDSLAGERGDRWRRGRW